MLFLLPALASAIIYPFGSLFLKRSLDEGGGVLRGGFIANLVLFACFGSTLLFNKAAPDWTYVGWALLGGLCFFGGQFFTLLAIRSGDVSVQSPLMGMKVVFVAFFSFFVRPEEVPPLLWAGSALSAAAILLLGGGTPKAFLQHWRTVMWSLIACACFGASDTLVSYRSADFGRIPFLVTMTGVVVVCSFALFPFFSAPLRKMPRDAVQLAIAGGFALGLQGVILNLALAFLGHATAVNIIYSTRALWGVLLVWLLGHKLGNREALHHGNTVMAKRLAGSLLLCASVVMVFL